MPQSTAFLTSTDLAAVNSSCFDSTPTISACTTVIPISSTRCSLPNQCAPISELRSLCTSSVPRSNASGSSSDIPFYQSNTTMLHRHTATGTESPITSTSGHSCRKVQSTLANNCNPQGKCPNVYYRPGVTTAWVCVSDLDFCHVLVIG